MWNRPPLLALLLVLVACATPPATGRLEVRLEGLTGLSQSEWDGVRLTGPGGFDRTLHLSASLPGREVGTYSLEAPSFTARGNRYTAQVRFGGTVATSGALMADQTLEITVRYTASALVSSTTGTLNLTLSGPDLEGFAPNVSVSGPNGYSRSITTVGPTALTDLEPGTYLVEAQRVAAQGLTVATAAPQVRVAVSAGQVATANLVYAPVTSSLLVELGGLQSGDVPTVTLRPAAGASVVCGPSSPASLCTRTATAVRFLNLAFGEYEVRASAARGSFEWLGAPSQRVSPSATNPLPRLRFDLTLRPAGQLVTGGNGYLRGDNALYSMAIAELASGGALTRLRENPDLWQNCVDTVARSPYRTVFDAEGNLYITFPGTSGGRQASCPPATNGRTYVYIDAFILRVTPENLRQARFFEIGTRSNGTEYAVPAEGNKVITKGAIPTIAQNYIENFVPTPPEPGVDPNDLTFDAEGNLWLVNAQSGLLACVSGERLRSSNPRDVEISFANQMLANPYFDPDSDPATRPSSVDNLLLNTYNNPSALTFDAQGNLWFTSDGYEFGAFRRSRLNRIPASQVRCPAGRPTRSPAFNPVVPDVRLDISLNTVANPFFNPSALALAPDGNALWLADKGGNDDIVLPATSAGLCPRRTRPLGVEGNTDVICPVGADRLEETLIQVPIRNPDGSDHPNATPNTANQPLKPAIITDRIAITSSGSVGPGELQEPMALAFDAQGRLWVATNNNMMVTQPLVNAAREFPQTPGTPYEYLTPRTLFATALRDRRGKLFGLSLPTVPSPNPNQPRPASNTITLSADTNVGLTGVTLYFPSP